MKIDIERLESDRAYWDEKDPTNGEATHFEPSYRNFDEAWVKNTTFGRHYWQDGWINADMSGDDMGDICDMIKKPVVDNLSERPKTHYNKYWDGVGTPRVGEKLNFNSSHGLVEAYVIGVHESWLWLHVPFVGRLIVQNKPWIVEPVESSEHEALVRMVCDAFDRCYSYSEGAPHGVIQEGDDRLYAEAAIRVLINEGWAKT